MVFGAREICYMCPAQQRCCQHRQPPYFVSMRHVINFNVVAIWPATSTLFILLCYPRQKLAEEGRYPYDRIWFSAITVFQYGTREFIQSTLRVGSLLVQENRRESAKPLEIGVSPQV